MKKGSKLLLIFIFLITAVLGGVAIYIGWRLSQEKEITPEMGAAGACEDAGYTISRGSEEYCSDERSDGNCCEVCTRDIWQNANNDWCRDNVRQNCHATGAGGMCAGGTTTSAATVTSATTGGYCDQGLCWFQNSNGRCCVDAAGCASQMCTHNVRFELNDSFSCSAGQMVYCSASGPACTSSLCPPCTPSCSSGWSPCDCGTAGSVTAKGQCAGCSNDYWGCCCQQQTTTTPQTTTSTPHTTTSTPRTTTSSVSSSTSSTTSTTTTSTITTSITSTSLTSTTTTTTTTITTTISSIGRVGVFNDTQRKVPFAIFLIIAGIAIYSLNISTKLLEKPLNKINVWLSDSFSGGMNKKDRFEKKMIRKIEKKKLRKKQGRK